MSTKQHRRTGRGPAAKKTIVIRSAHNDRSATGSRITEPERIAMRDTARSTLRKL